MQINIMAVRQRKMGQHGSPLALSNSSSSSTCRHAPPGRPDIEKFGDSETEDAASDIVFLRGKQSQTFCIASRTAFSPISGYPSARPKLPDGHWSSR